MNKTHDFDGRWVAWQRKGRLHERLVRRRFAIALPVMAIAAALAYTYILR